MANDDQAQADLQTEPTAADQLAGTEDSTNSGTNTALDDWHASVAALDLDESSEPEQGEQPAAEAEESQEEAQESGQSEEPEQTSEEESEVGEDEDPEPEAKASKRIRVTDPTDQKVAAVAKAMGINFVEAAKIVEAQTTPKHQEAQEQSGAQVETVDSVQARIEELEDMEASASTALEFETANEHRKEANKLRNKLIDLKIAEVQEKSRTAADAERQFYTDYAKSEDKTVSLYPDAAVENSPMAKEMARLEAEMLELGDPLYHSTDKPFILAKEAAKNLGIPMKKPGTTPAKKTVQHRPMQPVSGNARTTTTDSAQKASEAIDGIGSMRDWRETVASL